MTGPATDPAADPAGHRSGHATASVDWDGLHRRAVEMMHRAYAPYSDFPVGVAGLVDDGRIVAGCNVENAAYGVALCAECGLVSQLHATGGGRLVAVYCVGGDGEALMACGRCRQLLWENGGPDCLVMTPRGVLSMADLLPQAFGRDDLDRADSADTAHGAGSAGPVR